MKYMYRHEGLLSQGVSFHCSFRYGFQTAELALEKRNIIPRQVRQGSCPRDFTLIRHLLLQQQVLLEYFSQTELHIFYPITDLLLVQTEYSLLL